MKVDKTHSKYSRLTKKLLLVPKHLTKSWNYPFVIEHWGPTFWIFELYSFEWSPWLRGMCYKIWYPLYIQNLEVFKNIGHILVTYKAKCSSIQKHARNINIDESRLKVETLPTNACKCICSLWAQTPTKISNNHWSNLRIAVSFVMK
jgi:hypothetical protein